MNRLPNRQLSTPQFASRGQEPDTCILPMHHNWKRIHANGILKSSLALFGRCTNIWRKKAPNLSIPNAPFLSPIIAPSNHSSQIENRTNSPPFISALTFPRNPPYTVIYYVPSPDLRIPRDCLRRRRTSKYNHAPNPTKRERGNQLIGVKFLSGARCPFPP